MEFTAKVWQSAKKGIYGVHYSGTFGFQISRRDRNKYFNRSVSTVTLVIEAQDVLVGIEPSFWCCCPEIRHLRIREYCRKHGLMPGRHRPAEQKTVKFRVIETHSKFAVSLLR